MSEIENDPISEVNEASEAAQETAAEIEETAEEATLETTADNEAIDDSVEATEEEPEVAPAAPGKSEKERKFSLPIVVGIGVAALVIGLLIGAFLLGGAGGSAVTGKTAVSEGDLATPIATYSYEGKSSSISVQDVIEQASSLDAARDADGNYAIPTADTVLGVVRNKLIVSAAEAQGITVSDDDVAEYASTTLGTNDYNSIAASYSMDVEAVKSLLRESCLMGKLRDSVVGTIDAVMPEPPAEPSGDDEDAASTPTKEYADYIIALAGDEWDAARGTWAGADGPYASTLSDAYEVTADGATYEAATAAYYVAYQRYSEAEGSVSDQWSEYVNGILGASTIEIYTLLA